MKPCRNGHTEGRYANGRCKACQRERSRKWEAENPEKKKEKFKRWYCAHREDQISRSAIWQRDHPEIRSAQAKRDRLKNREKRLAKHAEWVTMNRERYNALRVQWRRDHPEVGRRYRQRYPHKVNAMAARRRAAILRACPSWLSVRQIAAIETIYRAARDATEATGIPHHVDHIVPLRGKYVSGLHVPWNLQILTADENQKKNRRFMPTTQDLSQAGSIHPNMD